MTILFLSIIFILLCICAYLLINASLKNKSYVETLNLLKQDLKVQAIKQDQQISANQKQELKILELEKNLNEVSQKHLEKCIENTEIKTRLDALKMSADEKQKLLIESEQRLNMQFENLANKIFENSGKQLETQNKQSLEHLLSPLKDRLDIFKKQIQDSFGQEAKERHTLTAEIRHLQKLNEKMAEDAINLTNALKGNNKTQGNWGEVILNRILENSGLRKGHEYELQVSLKDEDNHRFQPDVIVHLPQGNDVIIDSKVTLNAYERYFNTQDEKEKTKALSEHLISVKNHIKSLGQKNYHRLEGIKSLDYILMFIPVEPAFLSAIDQDPSIINDALKQNIMIVSPTTLLVALKTIHNLWRYEYQNTHATKIAENASKLYDKFRGFIEDMDALGHSLNKAQDSYQNSMKKLTKGRGNIVGQIEQFRVMGVEVKKPMKEQLIENALDDFEND